MMWPVRHWHCIMELLSQFQPLRHREILLESYAPSTSNPIWEHIVRFGEKRVVGRPNCDMAANKKTEDRNDYEVIRNHLAYNKHVSEKRVGKTNAGWSRAVNMRISGYFVLKSGVFNCSLEQGRAFISTSITR
jgi:hypothetical protein